MNSMPSLAEIIGGFSIACIIGAFILSIEKSIWDTIEDDVAKDQEDDTL